MLPLIVGAAAVGLAAYVIQFVREERRASDPLVLARLTEDQLTVMTGQSYLGVTPDLDVVTDPRHAEMIRRIAADMRSEIVAAPYLAPHPGPPLELIFK